MVVIALFMMWYQLIFIHLKSRRRQIKSKEEKVTERMQHLFNLTRESDAYCISELRMDRRTFGILCEMIRDTGGLKATRNMSIEEIVAMFVYVLAHHKKSRTICGLFWRSRETVSRQFNLCLLAVLKLHTILLKKPEPITEDCTDERWKCFKNCLGALDGTLIDVTPPTEQKSRYRTRKGSIATNVLGVCSPNMQFIYVLPGWEGSAHDGRVLRNAISRPNGFRVPQGCYYLVDAGYCNADGFLAPYRGQRYHLNEFNGYRPQRPDEYFNMKHSKARNIIERCFGLLKGRFHAIVEMCKESGCSWNDAEKKISCEKQWYDDWCKTYKDAKGLWDVKFPYLGDLEIVYGRDRATGNVAEDFAQAVQDMEDVQNLEEGDEGLDAM
nr:protein ALP1-like [Coffea arabica]